MRRRPGTDERGTTVPTARLGSSASILSRHAERRGGLPQEPGRRSTVTATGITWHSSRVHAHVPQARGLVPGPRRAHLEDARALLRARVAAVAGAAQLVVVAALERDHGRVAHGLAGRGVTHGDVQGRDRDRRADDAGIGDAGIDARATGQEQGRKRAGLPELACPSLPSAAALERVARRARSMRCADRLLAPPWRVRLIPGRAVRMWKSGRKCGILLARCVERDLQAPNRRQGPPPGARGLPPGPRRAGSPTLVVTPLDQCLAAYPMAEWARLEQQLAQLPPFSGPAKALTRLVDQPRRGLRSGRAGTRSPAPGAARGGRT